MHRFIIFVILVFLLASCRVFYRPSSSAAPNESPKVVRPSDAPGSSQAAEVFALVNAARANGGVCGNIAFPPTPALRYDAVLERAAQYHSEDMQAANAMSHVTPVGAIHYPAGSILRERINQEGYSWRVIGENVAWNFPSSEAVVVAWLGSPEHCKNILSLEFSEIGVGKAGDYWAQEFGLP
jgi:uncharacterized protein YkwD